MTYDQENVLYWLIGAAHFGYVDLDSVQEWAGSDVPYYENVIEDIVGELWNIQQAKRHDQSLRHRAEKQEA